MDLLRSGQKYVVNVDGSLSFSDMRMRSECVCHSWISQDNFPIKKNGRKRVEVDLQVPETKLFYRHLKDRSFHFGDMEQAFALAAQHPDVQRMYSILVLGAFFVWGKKEMCPILSAGSSGRTIGLYDLSDGIYTHHRVLTIVSQAPLK